MYYELYNKLDLSNGWDRETYGEAILELLPGQFLEIRNCEVRIHFGNG